MALFLFHHFLSAWVTKGTCDNSLNVFSSSAVSSVVGVAAMGKKVDNNMDKCTVFARLLAHKKETKNLHLQNQRKTLQKQKSFQSETKKMFQKKKFFFPPRNKKPEISECFTRYKKKNFFFFWDFKEFLISRWKAEGKKKNFFFYEVLKYCRKLKREKNCVILQNFASENLHQEYNHT